MMRPLIFAVLAAAMLGGAPAFAALKYDAASARQARQTFTGVITDGMCANADHSQMQMGPTDPECIKACIDVHAAGYVLYDGKSSYILSDQKKAEPFAAEKVRVVGTLDTKTRKIQVESITAVK